MRLTQSLIPPWETAQVLIESPGVIRQAELAEFVRLREDLLSGEADEDEFSDLRESLTDRFEAGWLIEMGRVSMSRDHVGILCISDELPPWLFN